MSSKPTKKEGIRVSISKIIKNDSMSAEDIAIKLKEEGYSFATLKWVNDFFRKNEYFYTKEASSGKIRCRNQIFAPVKK